jgi:hypothetical protein
VAIGWESGRYDQSQYSIAIGRCAGNCNQGEGPWSNGYAVAIGYYAGKCNQEYHAVAIGREAGVCNQGFSAVAIGRSAGNCNQSNGAVAVGKQSGQCCQGTNAVAIGNFAGQGSQGQYSVAVGYRAGQGCCGGSQGEYSVAIGAYAGGCNQVANSIVINANSSALNPENEGLYINPVRQDTGNVNYGVFYNTTSKELTYATAVGGVFTQNLQADTGDYTLVITDIGKHIYKTGTGNVLIDTNANVAFPVGTTVTLVTGSANSTVISPVDGAITSLILSKFGSDASINVPVDTYVTMLKVETDKWMIQN